MYNTAFVFIHFTSQHKSVMTVALKCEANIVLLKIKRRHRCPVCIGAIKVHLV